jgi:hypothetical protein
MDSTLPSKVRAMSVTVLDSCSLVGAGWVSETGNGILPAEATLDVASGVGAGKGMFPA